jgi:hypothetical protein
MKGPWIPLGPPFFLNPKFFIERKPHPRPSLSPFTKYLSPKNQFKEKGVTNPGAQLGFPFRLHDLSEAPYWKSLWETELSAESMTRIYVLNLLPIYLSINHL